MKNKYINPTVSLTEFTSNDIITMSVIPDVGTVLFFGDGEAMGYEQDE